jgi:KDO2-lipid IV(A) lauroyltransferase
MARLFLGSSLKKLADRAPALRQFLWALEALLIAIPLGICRLLPPGAASRAGRSAFRLLGPHLDKTRKFRRNLALAFPDRSPAEIEALIRENWGNVGATLAEFPHLPAIAHGRHRQRLEIVNHSGSKVFLPGGKPAIFVAAHLSNWEIPAVAMRQLGIPVSGMYTPLQNPWLDRMLYRARAAIGVGRLLPRDGGIRTVMQEIDKGRSIGLLVDQRVDSGEPVSFFGHDMLTSVTPARLALRYGCDLIPVRVERTAAARFRVTFYPVIAAPAHIPDRNRKALLMTREINRLFEEWITEKPQEWMCSKRRWPKDVIPG